MSKDDKGAKVTIFGIDILAGRSPSSLSQTRYALVILQGQNIVKKLSDVSKSQLTKLIDEYKPDMLATDNVYELEANPNDLKNFIAFLPPKTKVIQVTGPPSSALSLQEVAIKQGIRPPSKLSPIEEAEACALLAERGVGAEVQFLENETQILICRNVSLGPGGSSQSRYRRKIHNSILSISKKIQSILDSYKFDYDQFKEESDFGLERSEFIVYAPRSKLHGIIKNRNGSYVKVSVNPIFREKVDFFPRKQSLTDSRKISLSRKLVIGVDPGTTCGLAILSIDASPIYLDSKKGLTRGDIIRIVSELGEPVIVASDVTPAPTFVEKLANNLNAILMVPERVLETIEKQDLALKHAQKYSIQLRNSHERDALAAVLKALQRFENKFRQAEARVKRLELNVPLDEVKSLIVRGYSIQNAIASLLPKPESKPLYSPVRVTPSPYRDEVRRLQDKIKNQSEEIEKLRALNTEYSVRVATLERSVSELSDKLAKFSSRQEAEIRREQRYQILEKEILTLRDQLLEANKQIEDYQQRLATIKHYRALESRGEVVSLKPIESFSKASLEKAFQLFDIKRGDLVLLIDGSGGGQSTAEELARRGIRAVITQTAMSHQAEYTLKNYGVPVIPSEYVDLKMVEGYPYAVSSDVEKAIQRMKDMEKIEMEHELNDIIDGYRRERDLSAKKA